MVKVKPNLWLDKTPTREKASVSQNSGTGSWVTGVVREVLDGGLLRVGVPADDPVSEAVVPSDGTVSAVGAVVRVLVDSRGRAVHGGAPVSVPEGADLVPSGAVGQWVQSGQDGLRTRLDQARTELESSMAALGVNLDEAVDNPEVVAPAVWAKIATFAKVTTEMLVAGDATIAGTAVVGDLVGNKLSGVTVEGGSINLVASSSSSSSSPVLQALWGASAKAKGQQQLEVSVSDTSVVASFKSFGAVVTPTPFNGFPALVYNDVVGPTGVECTDWTTTLTLKSSVYQVVNVWCRYTSAGGVATFAREAVTLPAGIAKQVRVYCPDGATIAAAPSVWVCPNGMSATVTAVLESVTWHDAVTGELSIRRVNGQPKIMITGPYGAVTTLSGDHVSYDDESGGYIGRSSWRGLVAPPSAEIVWDAGAGNNVASGADGLLTIPMAARKTLSNGFTVSGSYLYAPVSGRYFVSASCGFLLGSTQVSWSVAAAIKRSSKTAVDWYNDPAMTLPLIPNVATRPTATGVVRLSAGEGLCLAFWQNTGSWKPNNGTSRLQIDFLGS